MLVFKVDEWDRMIILDAVEPDDIADALANGWLSADMLRNAADEIRELNKLAGNMRQRIANLERDTDTYKEYFRLDRKYNDAMKQEKRLHHMIDTAAETIEAERAKSDRLTDEVKRLHGIVAQRGEEINSGAHKFAGVRQELINLREAHAQLKSKYLYQESELSVSKLVVDEKQIEIERVYAENERIRRALSVANRVGQNTCGPIQWYDKVDEEKKRNGDDTPSTGGDPQEATSGRGYSGQDARQSYNNAGT